jgi:adenosylcobinamide-phosphate synthase
MSTLSDPLILLAAVGLDLLMGEPPNRLHPVACMGWLIQALRKRTPIRGRWRPLLAGLGIVTLGLTLSVGVGAMVWWLRVGPLPWMSWIGLVLEVLLLKSTFSLRGLVEAASAVHRPLQAGDLVAARRLLAWHLVSRDTIELDEARVAAAVVESVAENASDSVVAPWLYYLIGGLPAALAYRFANTADALLGYRDAEREWLGKVPARLDDLLNLLPARLTALCILLWAPLMRQEGGCRRFRRGLAVWWRDAGLTASPNAGHPMSAAAGVLGIELEKIGHYRLGAGLDSPRTADIERALGMLRVVAGMNLAVVLGIALLERLLRC